MKDKLIPKIYSISSKILIIINDILKVKSIDYRIQKDMINFFLKLVGFFLKIEKSNLLDNKGRFNQYHVEGIDLKIKQLLKK